MGSTVLVTPPLPPTLERSERTRFQTEPTGYYKPQQEPVTSPAGACYSPGNSLLQTLLQVQQKRDTDLAGGCYRRVRVVLCNSQ